DVSRAGRQGFAKVSGAGPRVPPSRATADYAAVVTDRPNPAFAYGPYFRLESPTQTVADAAAQEATGELWGRGSFQSDFPCAKAYAGPLPDGARGIEFWTAVPPNDHPKTRPFARWGRFGRRDPEEVQERDGFAIIRIRVTKNTQTWAG
ncbi:MAG: hypothetical protein ACKVVT_17420, partial [Dehalococcoidia bacterium]